jgi:hypothetical protein
MALNNEALRLCVDGVPSDPDESTIDTTSEEERPATETMEVFRQGLFWFLL